MSNLPSKAKAHVLGLHSHFQIRKTYLIIQVDPPVQPSNYVYIKTFDPVEQVFHHFHVYFDEDENIVELDQETEEL